MSKKLVSITLALLMLANAVPAVTAQEETALDPTEYLVDISSYYNADTLIQGRKVTNVDGVDTVTQEGGSAQ